MMLERLEHGLNGYQLPHVPRATRSAKRRGSFKRRLDGSRRCGFDLLAIIAGKLLLERECPPSKTRENNHPQQASGFINDDSGGKEYHGEDRNPEICAKNFFVSEILSEVHGHNTQTDQDPCPESDTTTSSSSGIPMNLSSVKGSTIQEHQHLSNDCSLECSMIWDDTSSHPVNKNNLDLINSDDEGKLCNSARNLHGLNSKFDEIMLKQTSPVPRSTNMLESMLSTCDTRRSDNPKRMMDHHTCEGMFPSKKRKHSDHNSSSSLDCATSQELVCGSSMVTDEDTSPFLKLNEGTSIMGHRSPFQHNDSNVKLCIKSFRVPELFVEVPETATVGSLKRIVMESVCAILGGGLRVGVLLQGKKIRDDNKTLLQTGISQSNKLDTLGFSLEPNPSQPSIPSCQRHSPVLIQEMPSRCSSRCHHSPNIVSSCKPYALTMGNAMCGKGSSPLHLGTKAGTRAVHSNALVATQMADPGPLTVVPAHRKPKHPDIAQRRIRRPFSVAEVENLVKAVEELGTGRWRDVKLRAFDNSKHRTYVDLKDKWKTLVHTAQISPQQRRGEPVPQGLLDRVLVADARWTQQQSKPQLGDPLSEC